MASTIPLHAKPQRGLADLRTLGGAKKSQAEPYKAFLRISFLELERARHKGEMLRAHHRVNAIAARCREIEREKGELLAGLRMPGAVVVPEAPRDLGPKRRKFRLSY